MQCWERVRLYMHWGLPWPSIVLPVLLIGPFLRAKKGHARWHPCRRPDKRHRRLPKQKWRQVENEPIESPFEWRRDEDRCSSRALSWPARWWACLLRRTCIESFGETSMNCEFDPINTPGLSEVEAAGRLREDGYNEIPSSRKRSINVACSLFELILDL